MAAASTTPRSLRPSKRPASAPPRAACACAASYGGWRSDRAERRMWLWRGPHLDRVAGAQIPADQDDGHDARLADDDSSSVPAQHGLQQARLEVVYLIAGVAQASDPDHGLRTQAQPSAGRQRELADAGVDLVMLAEDSLVPHIGDMLAADQDLMLGGEQALLDLRQLLTGLVAERQALGESEVPVHIEHGRS